MRAYRVGPKGGIMLPDGNRLRPGEMLPPSVAKTFTKKEIENKLRDGFLTDLGSMSNDPDDGTTALGGVVPGEIDTRKQKAPEFSDSRGVHSTSPGGIVQSAREKEPAVVRQEVSLWTIDPSTLKGRDLDQLRVMIAERDPRQDTTGFKTVEEAIEFLSQDFQAATREV